MLNLIEYLAPRYDTVRDRAGMISDRLANNLSGIATIKSFTTEAYESQRVNRESDAYRCSNKRAIALSVAFEPALRFLILLGFVLTLYLGGREVLRGDLTVGTYKLTTNGRRGDVVKGRHGDRCVALF
jgi:ATP-binding cassette subfamily B protein